MNPLTLPFYPPILETQESLPSHQAHRILHPDDQSNDPVSVRTNVIPLPSHPVQNWSLLDKKFKASLPAQWLLKRTAYQAVLSQAVPKLIELDGQILGNRERRKLKEILKSVGEQ